MGDSSSKSVLEAAADVVEAAAGLVRAVSSVEPKADDPKAAAPGSGIEPKVPGNVQKSDSPGWLDFHHPGGHRSVKALGEAYYDAHVPASAAAGGAAQKQWDPALGATWKDFARIYRWLFDAREVLDSKGGFVGRAYGSIQDLQALVGQYNPNDPDEKVTNQFPWPPPGPQGSALERLPNLDLAWTKREAISIFLAQFNKNADGSPADRDADFGKKGGSLLLTHGQVVELLHVFERQEDLRLLAPYDVLNTRIW